MTFKPMREDVQEVVDFALQCNFLFASEPPEGLDVKVVSSWPKDFIDAGPDGKDYKDLEDDDSTFRGICSEEISETYGLFSRDRQKNSEAARPRRLITGGRSHCLYERIKSKMPSRFDPDELITECIEDDMTSIVEYRVAFGRGDGFWDKVFEIYKSGGMPVGWSGKYPQGRFMAIYPGLQMLSENVASSHQGGHNY